MKTTQKKATTRKRTRQKLPKGWDQTRIKKVLAHYENQSEDEAAAEDDAAFLEKGQTVLVVPNELLPQIRKLLENGQGA